MKLKLRSNSRLGLRLASTLALAIATAGVSIRSTFAADVAPNNEGAATVISASWLGGKGTDNINAVGIQSDGTVVLAGVASEFTPPIAAITLTAPAAPAAAPGDAPRNRGRGGDAAAAPSFAFIARVSADGSKLLSFSQFPIGTSIRKLQIDPKDNIYVLFRSAGSNGVIAIAADGSKILGAIPQAGADDFGIDSNGDVVVLAGPHLMRFGPQGGPAKWNVTWSSHGGNRPGGIAVAPTGITGVVGYGMTGTGREPYKDPYAYGFDRDGKQIWQLWNPDPKKEQDAKFGGNGLMADTTGIGAGGGEGGKILLMLRADGGNTICSRDPQDPFSPIDPSVFSGVFQGGAGYGFHGASSTSVIFRIDPSNGKLEKGTWMSAWPSPAHAAALFMTASASDESGNTLVVGNSSFGCPTAKPWYVAPEGGYKGGGFLAILDHDFKMLQCGYFPGTTLQAVASRGHTLVVAGHADETVKAGGKGKPEINYPVPTYHSLQPTFGGGDNDAYFIILHIGG